MMIASSAIVVFSTKCLRFNGIKAWTFLLSFRHNFKIWFIISNRFIVRKSDWLTLCDCYPLEVFTLISDFQSLLWPIGSKTIASKQIVSLKILMKFSHKSNIQVGSSVDHVNVFQWKNHYLRRACKKLNFMQTYIPKSNDNLSITLRTHCPSHKSITVYREMDLL